MVEVMGNQIPKSRFKAKALEYFRQVEADGASVIVTDHGRPTLEVRPYQAHEVQPLDLLRGSVLRFDEPTEPVGDDEWAASQ